MSEALVLNIPGKLEKAAPALGLSTVKDDAGHRLMLQMCRPRKPRKDEDPKGIYWWDEAEKKERLYEYCRQDVRTEQGIAERVMRLRPSEHKIFLLDAKINDRGVYIDKDLCVQADKIVTYAIDALDKKMFRVTNGGVSACTNTRQLTTWLNSKGVICDSVAKEALATLLIQEGVPDDCLEALKCRQDAAKTTTAKIAAMLRRRQADGRMRGNLQYYGAGATGRWAARGAQLQNLTRPKLLDGDTQEEFEESLYTALQAVMTGDFRQVEIAYGETLTLISDCIRSMICSPKGKDLLSSDFANIEGRCVAWLAGQEDKLDAFRAYDAGTGPDLYLVAAAGIFGTDIPGAKPFRQIGKVAELSLGYQGGPSAFAMMAPNYGIKIGDHYETVWRLAQEEHRERAEEGWAKRGKRSGMAKQAWLAAEVIKLAWREKNPRIVDLWRDIEDAAIEAVTRPREIVHANQHIAYRFMHPFLFCRLPCGRMLCYPYARMIEMVVVGTMTEDCEIIEETITREEAVRTGRTILRAARSQLRYKSVHPTTRQWAWRPFYGGLGVENITQATSRDIMAEAMLRVEAKGYEIVLTVHDEIVAEVPEGFGSLEEFSELMVRLPTWAEGFPITAAGWRGKRYRKG